MPGAAPAGALDPWSAGFNALGSVANGIGQAMGGPAVSGNTARDQAWNMNGQGWTVSIPQALGPGSSATAAAGLNLNTLLLIAAGLVALWIVKR